MDCKPKRCYYARLERRIESFQNTTYDPIAAHYGFFLENDEKTLTCFICLKNIEPNEPYYHKPCGFFPKQYRTGEDKGPQLNRSLRYQPATLKTTHPDRQIKISFNEPISRSNPIPTPKGMINLCKICLENDINICLMPCNHVSICEDCLIRLEKNNCKSCPVCRMDIKDTLKIFLS